MREELQRGVEARRIVFEKVQKRAGESDSELRYMTLFAECLEAIRRDGEADLLAVRPAWGDPTGLAAEIEALSAYRALTVRYTTIGYRLMTSTQRSTW